MPCAGPRAYALCPLLAPHVTEKAYIQFKLALYWQNYQLLTVYIAILVLGVTENICCRSV